LSDDISKGFSDLVFAARVSLKSDERLVLGGPDNTRRTSDKVLHARSIVH
jgi:hypothetical protein